MKGFIPESRILLFKIEKKYKWLPLWLPKNKRVEFIKIMDINDISQSQKEKKRK